MIQRLMKSLFLALTLFAANHATAEAGDVPKFEIGPILSAAKLPYFVQVHNDLYFGYGARITGNLNTRVGMEFQISHFPSTRTRPEGSVLQGSAHVKLSYRAERSLKTNFFVIAGPGFLYVKDKCCPPRETLYRSTSFAINLGGGAELVPHRRWAIRFDATDFLVCTGTVSTYTIHNFEMNFSIMFRF